MKVTGLKKGGIYNHFESREALALEAFNYAFERMRSRILAAIAEKASAKEKLQALVALLRQASRLDALQGGCPIMNLSIESDDADPRLRAAARHAMGRFIGVFEKIIAEGIKQGEFGKGNAHARAAHMVASWEGAIMLSNLYKDDSYLKIVAARLEDEVAAGLP
jgi:AcrR family transcriptional regulator